MSELATFAVSALLILDFSGSMNQMYKNETKEVLLKKTVQGLASSMDGAEKTELIYFGTEPRKGCRDIKTKSLSAGKVAAFLRDVHPGPYGKTPLAQAISRIPSAYKARAFQEIVLLTDGADSCGQDPCAALLKADSELGQMKKKIRMLLIGYDLKKDAAKFQCFNDLKNRLHNISLDNRFSEADGGLSQTIAQFHKVFPPVGYAAVEIAGAPADAKFKAVQPAFAKEWLGAFKVVIKKGPAKLSFIDPGGKTLQIEMGDQEQRKIPFGHLVQNPQVKVELNDLGTRFRMKPTRLTKVINPEATDLRSTELSVKPVYFGDYDVDFQSPEWLVGQSLQVEIARPGQPTSVVGAQTLDRFFKNAIRLLPNDVPNRNRVLEIDGNRYLIESASILVPTYPKQSFQWDPVDGEAP